MYVVFVLRVICLLLVVPMCSPSAFLDTCNDLNLINNDVDRTHTSPLVKLHKAFYNSEGNLLFGFLGGLSRLIAHEESDFLTIVWASVAELVMSLSLVWVVLTLPMVLLAYWVGPLHSTLDVNKVRRIDQIADAINESMRRQLEDPGLCRGDLERLSSRDPGQGGCKTLDLTSPFKPWPNPYILALGASFHLLLKLANASTFLSAFFKSRNWNGLFCGIVLGTAVVYGVFAMYVGSHGWIPPILHEARISMTSGIFTPRFLELLKNDKGILMIPAFIATAASLPWVVRPTSQPFLDGVKAIVQVVGMLAVLFTTGIFVHQQFDWGVEREGMEAEAAARRIREVDMEVDSAVEGTPVVSVELTDSFSDRA